MEQHKKTSNKKNKCLIKVITTKGPDDKNPTVNWIYSDADLKKFAELKQLRQSVYICTGPMN